MEYLSKLPERLKFLMLDREDIKSDALGKAIGVCGSTIRCFLRGKNLPSLATAVKLADFFECSLDFLAGKIEIDRKVTPRPLPPFYENLRKVMKERNITRYFLTHKTREIRDSHFSNWIQGDQPKLITVCILAKHLDVSLDYLVGRTDY